MDPQTPEVPVVPVAEPPKKDSHWITILAMALFVLASLGITAFLYYQNQQLKSMLATYQSQASPTPTATSDPTAGWETHTNTKYNYEFKCPPTSTHKIELTSGDGLTKPLYQETCYENQNQFKVAMMSPSSTSGTEPNGIFVKEILSPEGKEKAFLRGFDESYFNQILSTFKFLGPTTSPSATQKACTQEARLCPDGSYVGRTGQNCEFAPCP